MSGPTYAQLRAHDKRVAGMLADPECVGEILLVGIGMARSLDLGDPPWVDGYMPMPVIADAIYGRRQLPGGLLGTVHLHDRGDHRPRYRIKSVFFADRRRYSADVAAEIVRVMNEYGATARPAVRLVEPISDLPCGPVDPKPSTTTQEPHSA
jgi:hypothetical protein